MGGGVISKLIVAESFLDQTAPTMDIAAWISRAGTCLRTKVQMSLTYTVNIIIIINGGEIFYQRFDSH